MWGNNVVSQVVQGLRGVQHHVFGHRAAPAFVFFGTLPVHERPFGGDACNYETGRRGEEAPAAHGAPMRRNGRWQGVEHGLQALSRRLVQHRVKGWPERQFAALELIQTRCHRRLGAQQMVDLLALLAVQFVVQIGHQPFV